MSTGRLLVGAAVTALAVVTGGVASKAETPLERGKYLVESIAGCGNCHTPQGPKGPMMDKAYAGGLAVIEPGMKAYSSNITPDKETGIGTWTVEQIMVAVREGKRPDGSLIRPPMPIWLYRGISDADARAIAIYIKSLKPIHNVVPKGEYKIPLPKSYGPPVKNVKAPLRSNKIAYGRYLAGPVGHCMDCHTPFAKGGGKDVKHRLFAGGQKFEGPWGTTVSRNITPDKTDGIGAWSDAEIKRAITQGISRDGSKLGPPMGFAYYAKMTDSDIGAIIAYLRSVKPLANGKN
jgi:mono/diheme cytochrome c family protein